MEPKFRLFPPVLFNEPGTTVASQPKILQKNSTPAEKRN
jgi:hypothetical protein